MFLKEMVRDKIGFKMIFWAYRERQELKLSVVEDVCGNSVTEIV